MKILQVHYSPCAGVPWRMEHALRDRGHVSVRANPPIIGEINSEPGRMGFTKGESCFRIEEISQQVVDAFDVVHFHEMAGLLKWSESVRLNHAVLTIHGDPERQTRPQIPDFVKRVVVTTPDLLKIWPEAELIPCFIRRKNLPSPRFFASGPKPYVYLGPAIDRKGEEEAWETLRGLDLHICREMRPSGTIQNQELLETLQKADFVWDHMDGYFGILSMEAMAVGAMPLFRLDVDSKEALRGFYGRDLPIRLSVKEYLDKPDRLLVDRVSYHQFWMDQMTEERTIQAYEELYQR